MEAVLPPPETEYIWMDGNFIKWSEAKVHVLTHCLHYGTGVFEGIRGYPGDGNLYIFRLEDHLKRLERSAKIINIPMRYSAEELGKVILELLRINKVRESVYIRPIVFVGYGGIGVDFSGFPVHTAICAIPFERYFSKRSLNVCTSTWRRLWSESLPPSAKACGNYLNSVLAKMEAVRNGFDEAILLDHNGYVSEGTGENVFVIKDGELATPPLSASILEGITRDSVIRLSRDEGLKVSERMITRSDLYTSDEIFLTGTAAEITPVVRVDGRIIGDGQEGGITRHLREVYSKVVRGQVEKYRGWLTSVY